MVTQTIEFQAQSGLTLTAYLFTPGNDTAVGLASATENTNDKGTYTAAFTGVAAGTYRLKALNGSSIAKASWSVDLTLATATFYAYEPTNVHAIQSGAITATSLATGAITSAKFAAGAIDAAAIATDAIDADALASDAVQEVVDGVLDEATSGHATSGTVGKAIADAVTAAQAAEAAATAAAAIVMQSTTIATLTSQTEFTLTAGSADNDAYNDCIIQFQDQSTSTQKWLGYVADYVGSTKTVKMLEAPGFTVATGDTVRIITASTPVVVRVDATFTSSAGTAMHVSAWLDLQGRKIDITGDTCSISFQELSADVAAFTVTDSDVLGSAAIEENVFRLLKSTPGLTDDRQYLVQATITHNGRAFTGTAIIPVLGGA